MQIQITDILEHYIEEYEKYQENKKMCEYIQDRIDYDSEYWHELEEKIKDDRHWIEMYSKAIADEIAKEYEYTKNARKYLYVADRKEAGSDE